MNSLLNKVLNVLREHVNQNNDEIRYNQDEIKRLLAEQTSEKNNELDYKYTLNKELLDENADFINLQLSVSEFLDKYGHLFPPEDNPDHLSNASEDTSDPSKDTLFQQTVKGKVKFDRYHLHFNDPVFFKKLLKYYEDREDYEMCDRLLKMIRSHS